MIILSILSESGEVGCLLQPPSQITRHTHERSRDLKQVRVCQQPSCSQNFSPVSLHGYIFDILIPTHEFCSLHPLLALTHKVIVTAQVRRRFIAQCTTTTSTTWSSAFSLFSAVSTRWHVFVLFAQRSLFPPLTQHRFHTVNNEHDVDAQAPFVPQFHSLPPAEQCRYFFFSPKHALLIHEDSHLSPLVNRRLLLRLRAHSDWHFLNEDRLRKDIS